MGEAERDIKITAFLSYRQADIYRHENGELVPESEKINTLKTALIEQGITLKYDRNATYKEQFDSFAQHQVAGSRFIILFLTKDYLLNPFPLFELISIYRDPVSKEAIRVFPVRIGEVSLDDMRERFRDFWGCRDTNSHLVETRERLLKLLKWNEGESEKSVFFAQLEKDVLASLELVEEGLGKSAVSLDEDSSDIEKLSIKYREIAAQIKVEAERIRIKAGTQLQQDVEENLQAIIRGDDFEYDEGLELQRFWLNAFRETGANNIQQLSEALAQQDSYQLIYDLYDELERFKEFCNRSEKLSRWAATTQQAKQICGWLILQCVDSVWWLHHAHRMSFCLREGEAPDLDIDQHAFAEVIISRSLQNRQWAKFALREDGEFVPDQAAELDRVYSFKESSVEETVFQELCRLLKMPHSQIPESTQAISDSLLNNVVYFAKRRAKREKGKPLYLLIHESVFRSLEGSDWYRALVRKLEGSVMFVKTGIEDKRSPSLPCVIEERELIDSIREIYQICN